MAEQASTLTDPIVPLLLVLSATTGLVDAVSVLGLGKVFTANMTGNIAFLGFAVAGIPDYSWQFCMRALLLFLLGAGAGGRISLAQEKQGKRNWLLHAAAIEAVLLWIAASCALFTPVPTFWTMLAMIALTAAAMGLRNATVRQLKVADLTTTVLTLTITGLAADSPAGRGGNPNWGRRVGAVLAMLIGALLGALLIRWSGLAPPLALAGVVTLVSTFTLAREATS